MDEEEAERAAASAATQDKAEDTKEVVVVAKEGHELDGLPKSVSSVPAAQPESATGTTAKVVDPVPAQSEDSHPMEMDFDVAAVKRRHDEVSAASQERPLSQLEKQWKTGSGRGIRDPSKPRSSLLTRDDKHAP